MSAPASAPNLPNNVEFGISISVKDQCKENDGIIVRGNFRIPYSEGSVPKQAIMMPKHIALVVTRSDNYTAIKPFRQMVVFEDDVKDNGKYASGNFNFNVFDHIEFNGAGDYYILCSLGNYLSNIVKVAVT